MTLIATGSLERDAHPDAYDFFLDGVPVARVHRADPEAGWVEVHCDAGPSPRRKRGRVEAVHRESGVVRRSERKR